MLLLLIFPIWIMSLLLVAGLCAAARVGDAARGIAEASAPLAEHEASRGRYDQPAGEGREATAPERAPEAVELAA